MSARVILEIQNMIGNLPWARNTLRRVRDLGDQPNGSNTNITKKDFRSAFDLRGDV